MWDKPRINSGHRWNNFLLSQRKSTGGGVPSQTSLHHNGSVVDCVVTLIDETDASHPQKPEKFWIELLEMMTPKGFNVENSV